MAERRMFAKSIVLSDAFLDMPLSARCLYFTLGMLADDDGFVGNPKSIMRQCGASQDDLIVLLQKRYILSWDSGVIVIKHWRMNNYLQSDRHKKTTYLEELATLTIDERGAYTEAEKPMYTECIQTVYTDKDSIDKLSIGKDSKGKNKKTQKTKDLFFELLESDDFSRSNINSNQELKDAVTNWLTYKEEKKQGYKPTGLHSLLMQIEKKSIKHGIHKVVDAIERTMAAGYQGIGWYYLDESKNNKPTGTDWDSV